MSICNFPDLKENSKHSEKKHEAEILIKLSCVHSDAVCLPSHWQKYSGIHAEH